MSILRKTEWITRSNNQTFNSEWAVIWAIKKKSTFKRKSESLSRRPIEILNEENKSNGYDKSLDNISIEEIK